MFKWLVQIPRSAKRAIMVCFDLVAIACAVWAAFVLRTGSWDPVQFESTWWILIVMPLLTVPIL